MTVNKKWFIGSGILMSVFLLLWMTSPHLIAALSFLKDREIVAAYLESLGVWGPIIYLAILGAQVLTAILPGQVLMLTAGYLYGFKQGLALNLIGAVFASQLAFAISRQAGKPFVNNIIPAAILNRWDKLAQKQGFFFYMLCFWFPVIPSNATNYLAGLSTIPFWRFFLANFLGRLPGLIIITLLGAYGLELTWQQWLTIGTVGLALISAGRFITIKLENRLFVS